MCRLFTRVETMFTTFFTDGPVTDWDTVSLKDTHRFGAFHRAMLENGVYLAPSQFEACYLSLALKGRRFENTEELVLTLTHAVQYWNAHAHPYRWKKRPQEQVTLLGGFGVSPMTANSFI